MHSSTELSLLWRPTLALTCNSIFYFLVFRKLDFLLCSLFSSSFFELRRLFLYVGFLGVLGLAGYFGLQSFGVNPTGKKERRASGSFRTPKVPIPPLPLLPLLPSFSLPLSPPLPLRFSPIRPLPIIPSRSLFSSTSSHNLFLVSNHLFLASITYTLYFQIR